MVHCVKPLTGLKNKTIKLNIKKLFFIDRNRWKKYFRAKFIGVGWLWFRRRLLSC